MPKKENQQRGISSEVARLLREERTRQNMSMSRLAEQAGLSQQMVSYVERGMRNPTLDTLIRITSVLKVELWEIIKAASSD